MIRRRWFWLLFLFAFLPVSLPLAALAATDQQAATARIGEVLADEAFGETKTVYRWMPRKLEENRDASFWQRLIEAIVERLAETLAALPDWLGHSLVLFCRAVLYLLLAGGAVYLLYRYTALHSWLTTFRSPSSKSPQAPQVLFGLDLRPESLPEDLASRCRYLLAGGRSREAMSLLYRGTLSRLVHRDRLELDPSLTELECMRLVADKRSVEEAAFFRQLTGSWILTAYGHRIEETAVYLALIADWQQFYGTA